MGLPVILSVLHLVSLTRRRPDRDPEKGATDETSGDGEARDNDDEDDVENEDDEEDDLGDDPLSGEHRLHRLGSATGVTHFSTSLDDQDTAQASFYERCKSYVFPKEESRASLEKFVPNYRWTPIISGVVVPFSILLEIPGLTEHWYIRTEANNIVESRSNPAILDIGLAISMACALAANICLVMRFLEKRVKTVTLLTIVFLTIHGTLAAC